MKTSNLQSTTKRSMCYIIATFGITVILTTLIGLFSLLSHASLEPINTNIQKSIGEGAGRYTIVAAAESTVTTTAGEANAEVPVYFKITSEERALIEKVVAAESIGESYDGQRAVSQCILNSCVKDGIRPGDVFLHYKYTTARVTPSDSVKAAVSAVFDRGDFVTAEPIIYFYNPEVARSSFHESQTFIIEIGNHRFFKENASK